MSLNLCYQSGLDLTPNYIFSCWENHYSPSSPQVEIRNCAPDPLKDKTSSIDAEHVWRSSSTFNGFKSTNVSLACTYFLYRAADPTGPILQFEQIDTQEIVLAYRQLLQGILRAEICRELVVGQLETGVVTRSQVSRFRGVDKSSYWYL